MSETPDAPDTSASSQVTDHAFHPSTRNEYLCGRCSLGQAAHGAPEVSRPEERPQPLPVAEIDMSEMEEHTAVPIEQDDPIGGGRIQEVLGAGLSVEQQEAYEQHEMAACGSIDHLSHINIADTSESAKKVQEDIDAWGAGKRGRVLVDGERQQQHGDPVPNMERIARGWSIIAEAAITPQMVPLMMVWFKVVRESQNHGDDNLNDIEGYTEIMRRVVKELGT